MDPESALVVGIDFGTLDERLPDYFGRGANEVMHRLRDLRRDALTAGGRS